jgi:hypothetical protein
MAGIISGWPMWGRSLQVTSARIKLRMAVLHSAKNFFVRIIFQGEYFYRILLWFMKVSAVLCTESSDRTDVMKCMTVWESCPLANWKQKIQLLSKSSLKKCCLQS